MITILQRVKHAKVTVRGNTVGAIGSGFLALVGISQDDEERDVHYTAKKIAEMRVFPDAAGRFTHDINHIHGEVLLVSQFTLLGATHKGRRPSFSHAAPPEQAEPLFNSLCATLEPMVAKVARGEFGAHMEVSLLYDGPVTMIIDSKRSRRGNLKQ